MNPQHILLEFDAFIILSKTCFICHKVEAKDLALVSIAEEHRDLINFEHVAISSCPSCQKIVENLDIMYLLERLDTGLTTLDHQILARHGLDG